VAFLQFWHHLLLLLLYYKLFLLTGQYVNVIRQIVGSGDTQPKLIESKFVKVSS